ncbi:hypothetical protein [Methylobacterium sp. ID0610]|uniref:hypothetical protein n=1 Tax=Methylobacterium carpenticola TaxID=3344827 RepID=UPI0036A07346
MTRAMRAMRNDELAPRPDPITALRCALERHFASLGQQVSFVERKPTSLAAVRRALADRIEADLAVLDAIDGDSDLEVEDGGDDEPCLGAMLPQPVRIDIGTHGRRVLFDGLDQRNWAFGSDDDREMAHD